MLQHFLRHVSFPFIVCLLIVIHYHASRTSLILIEIIRDLGDCKDFLEKMIAVSDAASSFSERQRYKIIEHTVTFH
jgi:hypothetical protein